jgi:oligopeptide transport system substrate-binding protein
MRTHNRLFRVISTIIILVLIGSFIVGCKREDKAGGIFRIFLMEPVSLDPMLCWEQEGIKVIKQVWDGLVKYNPETLEAEPSIAESWDISDDNLVYTFNLKKGVKFHSGRELKAEDFVYSWNRVALKENASPLATHLTPIVGFEECQEGTASSLEGVKAVNDYTLEVTLKEPFADFINALGHSVFFPVEREDIDKWGDKYNENINGTGPFKFIEWKHDRYILLERNEDYWGDEANIDEVRFMIYNDDNAAFLDFKAGNLEYTPIPFANLQSAKEDPKLEDYIISQPLPTVMYLGLNINIEPFKNNKELREAINYIIDKQDISESVFGGTLVPATGIITPGIIGFQENASGFTFDPEKAKEKLVEAGYPNGEGLPILKIGIDPNSPLTIAFEAIQADAKEIGIEIEIEPMDWLTALDSFNKGDLHFFGLGWSADYPTMDNFLFPLFYSESNDNFTLYNNSEVDELILEVRKTLDEDKRIELGRQVEKIILKDAVFVPMFFVSINAVYQPYVKGFILDRLGYFDLSKVWLESV